MPVELLTRLNAVLVASHASMQDSQHTQQLLGPEIRTAVALPDSHMCSAACNWYEPLAWKVTLLQRPQDVPLDLDRLLRKALCMTLLATLWSPDSLPAMYGRLACQACILPHAAQQR